MHLQTLIYFTNGYFALILRRLLVTVFELRLSAFLFSRGRSRGLVGAQSRDTT